MFQYFIMTCIVLNSLMMTLEWYNQSPLLENLLESANYFFIVTFTVEFLSFLIAYGERYFSDSWRIFDMVIIVLSWIGIILAQYSSM